MAITAETRKSIVQLVVTAYNAAPGTTLLTDLVAASTGGASLADIATTLTTSSTFNSIYPTFQTSTEFATEFLGNLVPEASAAALAEGIAVVESVLNGGGTRADVILQAQTFLAALSESDAAFGTSAANFNNKVEVAEYHTITLELDSANFTDLQNVLASVTSDDATVEAAKNNATSSGGQQGQTYPLSTGADAPTGTAADDLFVATEATLSSADILDGGAGTDTLRYASSSATPVSESGFESKNIETIQVTSDSTGGTTFDTSGVTELATLRNSNSSEDVTFTGTDTLPTVSLINVGSAGATANDPTPDTTLIFDTATIVGTEDKLSVQMSGNLNVDGSAIGDLTANGVEQMDIDSSGSASRVSGVISSSLNTINVTGDAALNLGTVNFQGTTPGAATKAGNTLNAGTFSGGLTVVLGNNSATTDVAVTGGTGKDRVDFGASYDKLDSFDGGDDSDTVAMTNAVATGIVSTNSGSVTNVETLAITDAGSGTIDMDNFGGVTKVSYEKGLNGAATVTDTGSAITVAVFDDGAGNNLTLDPKTDSTADVANIELHKIGAADTMGTITTADNGATDKSEYETVNLTIADDAAVDGVGVLTIANLVTAAGAQVASDMTITATADVTFTAATTNAPVSGSTVGDVAGIKTLDASASTADVNVSAIDYQSILTGPDYIGATITMGSGDDTVYPGNGMDTITLGAGKDTVYYDTVAQSDRDVDTITDFVSGTDKVNVTTTAAGALVNWGAGTITNATQFAGNRATFGDAQGALAAGGTVNVVFQVDTSTVWVDVNGDGTLDNRDFRVKLAGVSSVTAADLGITTLTGNTVTLTAAGQTVNTASTTPGKTTAFSDTVNTTLAFLNGSTITGGAGTTDVLNVTTAGTFNLNDTGTGGTVTQMETLNLADGTNAVTFTAGSGLTVVNGGTGSDTIVAANLVAGATINGGDGSDTVTAVFGTDADNVNLGAGDDILNTSGVYVATDTLAGGSGTDTLAPANGNDLSAAAVSGFETLTMPATLTLDVAQYNAFTTVNTAGGADVLTLADSGTISTTAALEGYTATGANALTINVGVAATNSYAIIGSTATDTVNISAGWDAGSDTINAGAGGTDVVNISQALPASDLAAGMTNVEVINVTTAPTGALTIDDTINNPGNLTFNSSTVSTGVTVTNTFNGDFGSLTVSFGSGNDTISAVATGGGANGSTTLNLGQGNDIVTNILANTAGTADGILTFNFGISAAGNIDSNTIGTAGANLLTGDVISFQGVTIGALATTLVASATAGIANTVVISNDGTDSTLILDANGNGVVDAGADVQVTVTGQVLTTASFNVVAGTLVVV